jgi:hypothetical protein
MLNYFFELKFIPNQTVLTMADTLWLTFFSALESHTFTVDRISRIWTEDSPNKKKLQIAHFYNKQDFHELIIISHNMQDTVANKEMLRIYLKVHLFSYAP